jgi:hypothetical protein
MIWFFERDDQELRVETRYANDTGEYLLVICCPDGDQCERFTNAAEFRSRLIEIERRLDAERWARARTPVVVPDGLPRRSM